MALGKYFKTPSDRKRYTIDYSDWLDVGELVESVTFGVTPVDAPPLVVDGVSIDPGKRSIVFYASGGVEGGAYTVSPTMVSSGGQVREDAIKYFVRAA